MSVRAKSLPLTPINCRTIGSYLLTCAGALMGISGILMAVGAKLAYGGIFFAAAACMFFAARNFRIAEDRENKDNLEEKNI